jgi:hypothetical protein
MARNHQHHQLAAMQCFSIVFLVVATPALCWTGRLVTTPPNLVTWVIDGSNLACSRGVPNKRTIIIDNLKGMASSVNNTTTPSKTKVVLVFDGDLDEHHQEMVVSPYFQYIITNGKNKTKDRADNFIIEHVLPQLAPAKGRIHLVTADKELAKRVMQGINMKGGSVILPPKFWKMYLPNLKQRQLIKDLAIVSVGNKAQ